MNGGSGASDDTLLAFDFGLRRIGVAVGNRTLATATALETIANTAGSADSAALERLVDEWRPGRLIVGRPTNMDGTPGTLTAKAERFARALAQRFALPVDLIDERLTSIEAQGLIRNARRAGRRRRARSGDVDKLAAQVILQSWLDRHAASGSGTPPAAAG